MKSIYQIALLITFGLLMNCGGKEEKSKRPQIGAKTKVETKTETPAS